MLLIFGSMVSASSAAASAETASDTAGVDAHPAISAMLEKVVPEVRDALLVAHGEAALERIERGVMQAATFWRAEDGDAVAFKTLCTTHFVSDPDTLDVLFERYEFGLEQLYGHMHEIDRAFGRQVDLDLGPILPVDELMAAYDPAAHIQHDFFDNGLAFVVLLNFPLTTLEQRIRDGESWSRRQWAEARLAQQFSTRVPAEVNQKIGESLARASQYIAEYNIWMHHLVDNEGRRLFPPRLRLISHWNLRDDLKAAYSDPEGLPKQRMIQKVMEHIVYQTIPQAVINTPFVDWNPDTGEVTAAAVSDWEGDPPGDVQVSNAPEPNTRYAILLDTFHAARLEDQYSPMAPTLIERQFNEGREMPEEQVRQLLEDVLTSPNVKKVARLIRKRLGRKLEPFDIWYNGFRPRGAYTEEKLDELVRARYPTAEAFEADIPNILQAIGFSEEKAGYLSDRIVVDASRGAGHAMGASRRGDKAHLRTRVGKDGMDYKGFNVAVHELGHNVEQTFSLYGMDHYMLEGVPNTAFTEALAFVFQAHDLELLGLTEPSEEADALRVLDDFWAAYEIAGVAMVDIEIWRWMYAHPEAGPEALRDAMVSITGDVWNRYYAPVFKTRDVVLPAIYSHIISYMLYTPDYPLGHLIAFQILQQIQKVGDIGGEVERMAKIGAVAPDIWMKEATGAPVSAEPLLEATSRAVAITRAY